MSFVFVRCPVILRNGVEDLTLRELDPEVTGEGGDSLFEIDLELAHYIVCEEFSKLRTDQSEGGTQDVVYIAISGGVSSHRLKLKA